MKKRIFAYFLLASMLLSTVSCSGTNDSTDEVNESDTTAAEVETIARDPDDKLPDRDFNGETYNILTAAEGWADKYVAEENTGDVLGEAVYKRNLAVEERFNVKLAYDVVNGNEAGREEVSMRLDSIVITGDTAYDLFVANCAYVGTKVVDGVFANLSAMEYLDFSAPWWYKNANENLSIKDTLFVAAGAYGLYTIGLNTGVIFSTALAEQHNLPSFYDDVRNGTWTYDKMVEYGNYASYDVDGNGGRNEKDSYGILSTGDYECIAYLVAGMGVKSITKDENGLPVLTGDSEHMLAVTDKLKNLMEDKELCYTHIHLDQPEVTRQMFTDNRALFFIYQLTVLEEDAMRDGADYGILPLPKYNEDQKEYYSSSNADIAAIPLIVKNKDMAQIILEAQNYISYKETVDVYYENVFKTKLARDENTKEMWDIILAGTTTEMALLFYRQLDFILFSHVDAIRNTGYATWWAANESQLTSKLETLVNKLEEISSTQENT